MKKVKVFLCRMAVFCLVCCTFLGAAEDNIVVKVGTVTYDAETVQTSLNVTYGLYAAYGMALNDTQKQQLIETTAERFVGLAVLQNQLKKAGQGDIDEATEKALDEQARQSYESAWQQISETLKETYSDVTDAEITAFMNSIGYTLDAFRQELEYAYFYQRVLALYCPDLTVTDEEVSAYYDEQYVSVYRERYQDNIPLFEEEILQTGGESLYMPEGYRRMKHIVLALPDDVQAELETLEAALTEQNENVQTLYEAAAQEAVKEDGDVESARAKYQEAVSEAENTSAQITAVLDKAKDELSETTDAIYAALEAGESFETLMAAYSYDTNVAPEDAGYLLHADSVLWDENFLQAALALENIGDVSAPVATVLGVHIILYAADEPSGAVALTNEQYAQLEAAALQEKQTERLDVLIAEWKDDYTIETHPEYLSLD